MSSSEGSNVGDTTKNEPTNIDVAVIGGGVVGLSCASELASRGRRVVVFDRDAIGQGCGIGSAGHLVPSHILPLAAPGVQSMVAQALLRTGGALSIDRAAMVKRPRWALDFALARGRASFESGALALRDLARVSGVVIDEIRASEPQLIMLQTGLLDVYSDAAAFESAQRHRDELERLGVLVEVLDGEAAREREPMLRGEVVGGLLFPGDRSVKPADLLEALVRRADAADVEMYADAEVLGLVTDGDAVTALRTARGDWRVGEVVIANGAAAGQFARQLGVRVPVIGARGHSVTFARDDGVEVHQPMLLGEDHVAVGPYSDQIRFSGRFEVGASDTSPSLAKTDAIVAIARRRLRLPDAMTVVERWAGLRPFTPDTLPIIGRPGRWRNVTIAAGHAMVGLSYGPGTGRVVAALVSGEPPSIDLARFSVGRFER